MTIAEEIQALEERLSEAGDAHMQADLIKGILMQHLRLRSTDGLPYTDRLLELAAGLQSRYYRAWALFHRSVIYRYSGDNAAALEMAWEAHGLFREEQDRAGMGNCLNSIGNIHEAQANYALALKSHLEALRTRQEIADKIGIANSLNNIALIYEQQRNYDTALDYYSQSLALMQEMDNKQGQANAYINIGNVCLMRGHHDEALKNYLTGRALELASGNEYGVAIADSNIGNVYQATGEYEQALALLGSARLVFEGMGNKHLNAQMLVNVADIYLHQGRYELALTTHLQALSISEEIGARVEISQASAGLMKAYRATGDYEKALQYYDRYHEIEKDILGRQAQKEIAELNYRHDIELSEKEAQLLKEKNEAINVYAQKLEISNNELKQFAHVASHDLREPLRMVSSYMKLLEQTLGDEAKPVQKQFIEFAVDGANRMEQLIHDLLRLAKVDANPQIERVPLSGIVEEVKKNLGMLLREKNAKIVTAELPAIMADHTQVLQLFQNIIGNGIKYNENPEPAITIGWQIRDADALLTIADNGIGIPEDYRERAFQLFQRVPTARQYQGTGIGLAICKKIVDGMGGTIAIDDREGGGTAFNITLPLSLVYDIN